ncbi:MAG TPA: DUF4157 domain-containing protein [Acidobacteriaceae bacterium]
MSKPKGKSPFVANTRTLPQRSALAADKDRGLGNQATLRLQAVQCKLAIGRTDDPLEHEADRVADQVMRTPDTALSTTPSGPRIQRKCASCEEEDKVHAKPDAASSGLQPETTAAVEDTLNSSGQPLDRETRFFMETRFNRDFSGVRVHFDREAAASARGIGARAYAFGPHMVFGPGQYSPRTPNGRRLIAHELTHTVQQSDGSPRTASRGASPAIGAGNRNTVRRVGECAGKSYRNCNGTCVSETEGAGACIWSGAIATGCICSVKKWTSVFMEMLYAAIVNALIAAGIILTAAAIAAIVACMTGPCEAAALIAALGYAGAMIVLGIIRASGLGAGASSAPTAAAGTPGGGAPGPGASGGGAPASANA